MVNLLHATGDSVEVRVHALPRPKPPGGGGKEEPHTRHPVTVVCKTEALFHEGHGEATLNLGPLFKRWQANGGHGANILVVGETTLRVTEPSARIEDIPLDDDEDAIINLTIKAPEPVPVPGISHVCQIELDQEQDGETVGGVNYGVQVRALSDTDPDNDGIPDVLDDDDDGDGVPDRDDVNPLGDPECLPSALTIRLVDGDVVVSWGGLGYRLARSGIGYQRPVAAHAGSNLAVHRATGRRRQVLPVDLSLTEPNPSASSRPKSNLRDHTRRSQALPVP